LAFLLLLLISCQSDEDLKVTIKPQAPISKTNPFSVHNIEKALQNVVKNSSGRIKVVLPSTTHNYVRFEPQNLNQVMLLQDLGYDLWDEPLDQHIEYSGDYYQQPGIPDSLNYFYTLIPSNYSIVQTVPHTIISQVILFDEDAGDEQDPEEVEDPWIPDPGPGSGYCYDEYGQPYICNSSPRIYLRKAGDGLPEDLLRKVTKELLTAGIDLNELYNQAMLVAGYEDEIGEINTKSGNGRTKSVRYYPGGRITMTDNSANLEVPVRNTFVKARRFFKLDHTYTDANGNFRINKGYRNKAQVIVKFKNNWANVRGVTNGLKIWQWTHPVKVKLGLFEKSGMQNITRRFEWNTNAESIQAIQFTAAHAINVVTDVNQYCTSNSLNFIPNNINLWVTTSNWFRSSTAPMLNKVTDPLQTRALVSSLLVPPLTVGSLAKKALAVLLNYAPDVAITINDNSSNGPARMAGDISGQVFHELSHAIHYNKVGRNYWIPLIATYINNFVSNGTAYGNKTYSNAGLVAVTESWGFFIGSTFTRNRYTTLRSTTIANDERNFLEFQRRDDGNPVVPFSSTLGYSRGWIPWGMLHDMTDVGEPAITLINDQVSGYTINGIYKGFGSSITTVQGLKSSILSNNANSQATQVNTLVTSYGW
jgi:hypothetical protein